MGLGTPLALGCPTFLPEEGWGRNAVPNLPGSKLFVVQGVVGIVCRLRREMGDAADVRRSFDGGCRAA